MFFRGSRYETVASAEFTKKSGRVIAYKRVRFIPSSEALLTHEAKQGDRLDLIAHKFYGDPEQFWRICDANAARHPEDLLRVGQRLGIPLPKS